MNKYILFIFVMTFFMTVSCSNSQEVATLERELESMKMEMDDMKEFLGPGLADLMNRNNEYVKKLDVALENQNWEYADFCLHEMEENFEKIVKLHNNHDELVQPASVQFEAFIYPVFHELEEAVESSNHEKSLELYTQLKTNCGSCHTANNHGFIVL